MHVDDGNPRGIPVVNQGNKPTCAAAATTSILWNWGSYSPFNSAANQLFPHKDPANYQTNWTADVAQVQADMATLIYGAEGENALPSYGTGGALAKWIGKRGYLNPRTNPGLSVFQFNGAKVTYDNYNGWVKKRLNALVTGGWEWHKVGGGYDDAAHALVGTGWDTTNASIIVANPWFGKNLTNESSPVDQARYTQYTIANQAGTNAPKIEPGTAANETLITDQTKFDFVDLYRFTVVRLGPAPRVDATVFNNANELDSLAGVAAGEPAPSFGQTLEFTLSNFDVPSDEANDTISNFYVELPASLVSGGATVLTPAGWNASAWDVSASSALFKPEARYDPAGPDPQPPYVWDPNFTGVHWFADPGAGLLPGESLEFSLQASFFDQAELIDLLAVSGNADLSLLNYTLTSVPEPATLGLVLLGVAALLPRGRRRRCKESENKGVRTAL